jgi:hypothetical protein
MSALPPRKQEKHTRQTAFREESLKTLANSFWMALEAGTECPLF